MGAIFSGPPKPPAPPPPPPIPEPAPLPTEDDQQVQAAKRKRVAEMQKRSGRQSTILSEGGDTNETLGGG